MSPISTHPSVAAGLRQRLSLARNLIARDITARYRGSVLGILWSLVTPLAMLAVYSLVFGSVLGTRWNGAAVDTGMKGFAIILFAGLIVFQLFADVIARAPTLVLSNVSYVRKVVFPLEILPVVALGSAIFHMGVSLAVLLAFMLTVEGHVPVTAGLLPAVLVPFSIMILGLGWFLASLGVYLRDASQVVGTVVTALMFLSPILFPSSALPEWIQPWLVLNPLTLPVEQTRNVLLWGNAPDWTALALYAICASAVAAAGVAWFQATRKGFADVL